MWFYTAVAMGTRAVRSHNDCVMSFELTFPHWSTSVWDVSLAGRAVGLDFSSIQSNMIQGAWEKPGRFMVTLTDTDVWKWMKSAGLMPILLLGFPDACDCMECRMSIGSWEERALNECNNSRLLHMKWVSNRKHLAIGEGHSVLSYLPGSCPLSQWPYFLKRLKSPITISRSSMTVFPYFPNGCYIRALDSPLDTTSLVIATTD